MRVRVFAVLLVTAVTLASAQVAPGASRSAASVVLAPVVERENSIPDKYVVVFGNGMSGPEVPGMSTENIALAMEAVRQSVQAEDLAEALGADVGQSRTVGYRYRWALIGFSVTLPRPQLERLRAAAGISWIESDGRVLPPPLESSDLLRPLRTRSARPKIHVGHYNEQIGAPLGLDRLGQRLSKLNGRYAWSLDGSGVHVYVVDTGVRPMHVDLRGRVQIASGQWYNATPESLSPSGCPTRYHGTRVASIIGGKTYGVAKAVTLHPVLVFGCAPTSSNATIAAGVEWVLRHYSTAPVKFPAVANMSLQVPAPDKEEARDSLYRAVANAIDAGITFSVAAGNGENDVGGDACYVTPARVPDAITVGGTRIWASLDLKMDMSNFGECVDLFAPGQLIQSAAGPGDADSVNYPDGTSFAAPHAAGVAALYLQNHRNAQAPQVRDAIFKVANDSSTPDWCGVYLREAGSPNVLLHWGAGSDDGSTDVEAEPPATPCPPTRVVRLRSAVR